MEEAGFRGLMSSLNIDDARLAPYDVEAEGLLLNGLVRLKAVIEDQLSLLGNMLDALSADMETPLTIDGFPRSDIDVVGIRLVRIRIIRGQNDLKEVMRRLGQEMEKVFASGNGQVPQIKGVSVPRESKQVKAPSEPKPFAIATQVHPQGPAYTDGIRDQDMIVSVDGEIDASNQQQLGALARHVRNHENLPIRVSVVRGGTVAEIVVTPRTWSGPGIMGCRFVLF